MECGEGEGCDHQAQGDGDRGEDQGLTKELVDDVLAAAAEYFADADLFGALQLPGGREIDEVDDREQQDKERYAH